MMADILRSHSTDQPGDHLQCCLVGREQPLNGGKRLRCRTDPPGCKRRLPNSPRRTPQVLKLRIFKAGIQPGEPDAGMSG